MMLFVNASHWQWLAALPFARAMLMALALLVLAAPLPVVHGQTVGNTYRIQPGDVLAISVWREEELQRDVLVNPDGALAFPLAGELKVSGMSVPELRAELESRLDKFIPEPEVTVSLIQVDGNRVFVIGQVNRPGVFVANPDVTVLQALALAGGFTTFADIKNIQVIRGAGASATTLRFDYKSIERGLGLKQNIVLESGDVVVVP